MIKAAQIPPRKAATPLIVNRDVNPPFAIQIEPAEGCSLACSFCGIQAIRDNGADADIGIHGKNSAPYRFMTEAVYERICDQLYLLSRAAGWNPRIEFAMHGEPTMHPDLPKMVRAFRNHLPDAYLMVTSNGSGLLKDSVAKVGALFDAGLNTLALDDYKHSGGWVEKIMLAIEADPIGIPAKTYHYPAQKEGNPHQRHTGRILSMIHDISENTTGTHTLTNQGGNSFAGESITARCAKPFRELSIRWDGNVAVCCDDWKGEYKIGNVKDMALDDIWYHERFEAARRHLYLGDRSFGGACESCNAKSTRVGLLPDKLGKSTMLAPDSRTRTVVAEALRGRVFTIKLARGD